MSHQYKRHNRKLSAKHDLKKLLPIAKKGRYPWMREYDSMSLQQALINLDRSFQNLFSGRSRYPKFKSRRGKQASYHCVGISVGENWIKIPKIGRIKARVHREVFGILKSITITRSATGKYFASLLHEDGLSLPDKPSIIAEDAVVGVDLGISHLAIESNGHKEENPRHHDRALANLRRKQRKLSRKKKGSNRRKKAKLMVAKAHERVANARADHQHKLSKRLVDENQAVIFETLNKKGMLKNRRLARHISDAAWGALQAKVAYKSDRAGKHVVFVSQWFASSKTCSCCGVVVEELPLEVRSWVCECGALHDRDINAALNIKNEGIKQLKTEGLSVSARGGRHKTGMLPAAA